MNQDSNMRNGVYLQLARYGSHGLSWLGLVCGLAASCCGVDLHAQEVRNQEVRQQDSQQQHSPAWDAISAELQQAETTLVSAAEYQVRVASQWKFAGAGVNNQGEHHLRLQSVGREQLLFEVRDQAQQPVQFAVHYQKPNLIRWAAAENKFSRVQAEDPRVELQSCGLTQMILELCAVEFLLMPHARESIQAQLVQVTDLGVEAGLHHFDVRLTNGHEVSVWFRDETGLPAKIKSHYRKATGDQQFDEVVVESQLDWQIGKNPNAKLTFELPPQAQLVADLTETLHGRGVEELYGKPLPALSIQDLAGKVIETKPAGKVQLYYFWATWAAPSMEGIPGVLEFRERLQSAGVFVLPINVAEEVERVRQFVEMNQVTGVMGHDPQGMAVNELRITHLPAVVIVNADGTVHQIIQNVKEDMRARIAAEIEKLKK